MLKRIFSAALLIAVISPSAFSADIVSKKDGNARVRVTELPDKNLRFELCSGLPQSLSCQGIGRESGYTRAQLSGRLGELQHQAKVESIQNVSIVVGSILIGGAYGALRNPGSGHDLDFSILVRMFDGAKFGILGGVAGTGILVLKKTMLDEGASARDTLSSSAGLAGSDSVILINDSMSDFVKSLNYALMTIH
jgi:hypothetical protein